MTKSSSLIFFGNERLSTGYQPNGAPVLQSLIKAGYDIKAVVSHFTPAVSRNSRKLEIETVAKAHDIPLLLPDRLKDIEQQLRDYNADAGVLVAYGKIIPQRIIDIFPHGIINIHPSLLPKHRGSTPIEQTILDGDQEAGVSLMQLAKEMDAGPLYAQAKVRLAGNESKQELTTQLLLKGRDLLIENLPAILAGNLKPTPQDNTAATYCHMLSKSSGEIDWAKPATHVEREIRAYATWPKSRTAIKGHPVIVTQAHIAKDDKDGDLVIACKPGWLAIDELIAPSGRKMNAEAFLRGYNRTN